MNPETAEEVDRVVQILWRAWVWSWSGAEGGVVLVRAVLTAGQQTAWLLYLLTWHVGMRMVPAVVCVCAQLWCALQSVWQVVCWCGR